MTSRIFITRQPVLNKNRAITANRLTLHALDSSTPVDDAVDMLDALRDVWPDTRTVFVGFPGGELAAAIAGWQAPENAMIEIPSGALADPAAAEVIQILCDNGTAICLADYQPGSILPTQPQFHFLLADAVSSPTLLGTPGLTIACGLPDSAAFDMALAGGYDGAAGWFFLNTRPTRKKLVPAHAQIVRLLNLVRQNAEVKAIEAVLKQDVALSVKLLRYINSAGFGLQCEIQSFRHAVTILGYDKLNKWLSLLLVTSSKDATAPALMQASVARGRFMEIVARAFFDKSELDNLFITGAFSLLDVLVGTELAPVLEELHLPEPVVDALLRRDGVYADFLDLALACESDDVAALAEKADALGMEAIDVNRAHMEALSFADNMEFS